MPLSAALSCPLAELAPVSSPIRQAGLLFGHSVGEEAPSPASPVLPPGPGHRPWCLAVPVPVVSRASAQTQSLRATCSSVVIHSQVSLSQPVSSTEVQRLLCERITLSAWPEALCLRSYYPFAHSLLKDLNVDLVSPRCRALSDIVLLFFVSKSADEYFYQAAYTLA